jgi:hypothetical protein
MRKALILLIGSLVISSLYANHCETKESKKCPKQTAEIKSVLAKMHDATQALKTCQAAVSYLYVQDPELLDSRTLRTGNLYYQKDPNQSNLRISFETLKQDDFEAEKRREEYLFDGVWLKKIDFKLQQIDLYQQTTEDKPIDVFELISHNFPLVGFSGMDTLEKDFDVKMLENEPNKPISMLLTTKENSKFKDEYTKIDFWADPKTYLPVRIRAYSKQEDVYDIRFLDTKINKKLKNSVFTIETPANFRKNIEPLKTEPATKGK